MQWGWSEKVEPEKEGNNYTQGEKKKEIRRERGFGGITLEKITPLKATNALQHKNQKGQEERLTTKREYENGGGEDKKEKDR